MKAFFKSKHVKTLDLFRLFHQRKKVSGMLLKNFAFSCTIRITCTCDSYPLTPHFYIVKLGFTGVYIIFLFLLLNIDYGYSLEPPR